MKPKTIYLALCFLGAFLPYWQFLPWVSQHGLNGSLFLHELFANRISAFFGMDVIVSALVVLVFMAVERRQLNSRKWWLPIAALLLVGVSLSLPLFLYLRELHLERNPGLPGMQASHR
jgi:Terpene cyclase DEP1